MKKEMRETDDIESYGSGKYSSYWNIDQSMANEELDRLAPWSIEIQKLCKIQYRKILAF